MIGIKIISSKGHTENNLKLYVVNLSQFKYKKGLFQEYADAIIVQFGIGPGFLDCCHKVQVVSKFLFANLAFRVVEELA